MESKGSPVPTVPDICLVCGEYFADATDGDGTAERAENDPRKCTYCAPAKILRAGLPAEYLRFLKEGE